MQTIAVPSPATSAPAGIVGAVSVASTLDETPIVITCPASVWATRLALKAEIAAKEKAVEEIDKALNLPEADSVARPCRLIVVDGNGNEVGKGSVYWFKGATYKAGWRRRIG